MSIITSTCEQISGSPLNYSKSKQLYTFPRADRFHSRSSYNVPFYQIPSTTMSRTTSLGIGNRDSLFRINQTPGPGSYALPSVFDKDANKGIHFGISRDAYDKAYLETNPPLSKGGPGPGSYQVTKSLAQPGSGYTLRPKVKDASAFTTAKYVPGPGQYQIPSTIDPIGKLFQSKYKSSKATTFSPSFAGSSGKRCNLPKQTHRQQHAGAGTVPGSIRNRKGRKLLPIEVQVHRQRAVFASFEKHGRLRVVEYLVCER
eukprot:TRINITY_DN4829_c0_g1_i10.p1 TRINITY_DN4829_c0_g1~~TRINITY_DN4829_c0_g1_i10.p1  ORF type:complete len:258 (-),score=5.14 TRINITY_DN4829_c0_g1_i10:253-1026(-)